MQYKIFLTFFLSTLLLSPVFAQKNTKVTVIPIPNPAKAVNTDTVITITGNQGNKQSTLLASNSGFTSPAVAKIDSQLPYNHVPLAGEKSYFGEKTDFVNDFVRKYMELHNRTLSSVQSNSAAPFSVIDNILEEKKMPKELKYLAVIESALNHNAVSHAGAVGPWQLMAATARMMGLTVNRKNDERKDWNKSTDAATKYLDLLYSQLNDWLLVIAAYNCGPTPVQRALNITGKHTFWDIKEYLPRETQGHVLAFIATASIFENLGKFINLGSIPTDFNFGKEKEEEPIVKEVIKAGVVSDTRKPTLTEEEVKNMSILKITDPLQPDMLCLELGMDKKAFYKMNQDYDMFILKKYASAVYNLHLPKDKVDLFLQKKTILTKKSKIYYAQNQL